MESIDKIITDEQAALVAEKVLMSLTDKIKEQLAQEFYIQESAFLHEHWMNKRSEIEKELVKEFSDLYIKNPNDFKYADFRKRLFEENKAEILASMSNAVIESSLDTHINKKIEDSYYFNWRWKDGIANFIVNNWHTLQNDEHINSVHLREIERLRNWISTLEEQMSSEND